MKIKHNKKRNTAFVYEALIREATVAVLQQDMAKSRKVKQLLKKHFADKSILHRDLQCYRSLYQEQNLSSTISEKILQEAKTSKQSIDNEELFRQQTAAIHDINKEISPTVFNNFVPNYKTLATIAQIFSPTTSPKQRVLLETQIIGAMTMPASTPSNADGDKLVYAQFVEKFNDKYSELLLPEQKELLSLYIGSFADNDVSLKIFLNEEIGNLRTQLTNALNYAAVENDVDLSQKAGKVISLLDSFASANLDENLLLKVLKIQELVKEIAEDGNNN